MESSNGSEETTLKLSMSIRSRPDRIASIASASINRTIRTVTPSLWSSKALRMAGASRSDRCRKGRSPRKLASSRLNASSLRQRDNSMISKRSASCWSVINARFAFPPGADQWQLDVIGEKSESVEQDLLLAMRAGQHRMQLVDDESSRLDELQKVPGDATQLGDGVVVVRGRAQGIQ